MQLAGREPHLSLSRLDRLEHHRRRGCSAERTQGQPRRQVETAFLRRIVRKKQRHFDPATGCDRRAFGYQEKIGAGDTRRRPGDQKQEQ